MRTLHAALILIALAALATGIATWVDLQAYSASRDVLWPLAVENIQYGLLVSALCLALWFAMASVGRDGLPAIVKALAFAPLAWGIFRGINEAFLPGFFELKSIVANVFLVTILAAASLALSVWLTRWRETTELRPPLVPGGALILGLVSFAFLAQPPPARRPDAPNVIVILIDVLRADHLSCYGYERETSPIIDAFADEAILFENPVAASTFTKTSVASLFSGLPPHRHGVYYGQFRSDTDDVLSDVLGNEIHTLAERMFDAGLHTEAWVENAQLRAYMGFSQGFSRYHDQPGEAEAIRLKHLAWLNGPTTSKPFFTYLHFLDVHGPYNPPEPFYGKFGPKENRLYGLGYDDWAVFKYRTRYKGEVLDEEELAVMRNRYDECIASIDRWIGVVFDDLREHGLYDDSLIVITGDHGEGFWEHGFISHSTMPFEELVKVPLIVKLPGAAQGGKRVSQAVSHLDLVSTLVEAVGGDTSGLEGQSLWPLLEDPETPLPPREHFVEIHKTIGLRTDRWKYFLRPTEEAELYDLESDPGEQNNVVQGHPDVAERMGKIARKAREIRENGGQRERVVVDAETVDKLHALGYIGD